ncbi:L-rhamnose mutarotase [Mucilaginibacter sp. KACC 22063]|uniref:L-rhamnose mutarotase n=1 Tax=Mucilaginibacter sp. KACC 22063 TaxID=3025666 RepID=UPI0023671524|nr:L-rhamnose mutarotase [Mucilaginibacter sp. KACC 22063]WDF57221.1 L-rhamnose mutarotase [Mucilaginibacter sp. KACC 22063]
MKRYCFALDLKDDQEVINRYEYWHRPENSWPEVSRSFIDSKIIEMQIYRTGNRLFMIMDTADDFSLESKAKMDAANPRVQEWELLMEQFQQPLPWAKKEEKWVQAAHIFSFTHELNASL